jgi:hypothetical protein
VANVLSAQKSFWTHPMAVLSDVTKVEARLDSLGDSANLD